MMLESDIQKQGPQNARLWHVLLGLRYILPLLSALLFVVLGVFYNVFALEAGKLVRISVLRLFFNTLKNARVYLMGGHVAPSVKSLYIYLL